MKGNRGRHIPVQKLVSLFCLIRQTCETTSFSSFQGDRIDSKVLDESFLAKVISLTRRIRTSTIELLYHPLQLYHFLLWKDGMLRGDADRVRERGTGNSEWGFCTSP